MHVLKFGMVGIANTAIDLAIFSALTFAAGVAPPLANVVSYSSGVAASFWMNRRWTFRDRTVRKPSAQLPLFVVGNLVGLALSTAIVAACTLVHLAWRWYGARRTARASSAKYPAVRESEVPQEGRTD